MLASDVNNPQFTGVQDPDSVMIVRFYKRAVKNNFKSHQEGRPIFEDKVYCEYYPAGSTLLKMDVPAHEAHKMRFAKQWAYYQTTQGGDSREMGTPLSQWAALSPADVENLKGLKFNTIENLAAASDQQLQVLGMGAGGMAPHVLRTRAQAYLAVAQDTALPQKQAEDIEALKKRVSDLTDLLKAKVVPVKAEPKAEPKAKREWTEEQKQAARDRMAKARAAKQQKVE